MLRALAACIASKSTAAGSPPGLFLMTSVPVRSPQISSSSMAAARNVSAAASSTALALLADGRRLANPIYPDHQDDFRLAVNFLHRSLVSRIQDGKQFVLQHALQLLDVAHLLAIDF